jgi:hypothetical protein
VLHWRHGGAEIHSFRSFTADGGASNGAVLYPRAMSQAVIESFWRWWSTAHERIAHAIDTGTVGSVADELSEHVNAIAEGLEWEIGVDRSGPRYSLCISAAGDLSRRALLERWLQHTPRDGDTWTFHPARQASRSVDGSITLDELNFPFADFRIRIEVDETRERVHITVFHPAFLGVSDGVGGTAAYLFLDDLLGEDGVERWIGRIERVKAAPDSGVDAQSLRQAVNALAAAATRQQYVLLEGNDETGARHVMVLNAALKHIDYVLFDMYVRIDLTLKGPTDGGMPEKEELDLQTALEEDLLDSLGESAVFMGHQTHRGLRTIHFYAPELGRAADVIRTWEARTQRPVVTTWRHDPEWSAARAFGL